MGIHFLAVYHRKIGVPDYHRKVKDLKWEIMDMEEALFKIKGAAALLQNMVSTKEEVKYNDLALFQIAKMLYEGIDEIESCYDELKNGKLEEIMKI